MPEPLAVVFVHGTRTSSGIWDSQRSALAAAGLDSLAIDLPGHGTDVTSRFTLDSAFARLDQAFASFSPQTPILLVGLSLGGYIALAYAAQRHPARLAGVLAAGCAAETSDKPLRAYRDVASAIDRAGKRIGPHLRQVRRSLRRPTAPDRLPSTAPARLPSTAPARLPATAPARLPSTAPARLPATAPARLPATAPGRLPATAPRPDWQVVTDMLTALAGTSAIDSLRAVDCPVWLVNGQHCHLRFELRRFMRARPDAQAVTIAGAGHDVNTDAPRAFNTVMLGVAAQLSAKPVAEATAAETVAKAPVAEATAAETVTKAPVAEATAAETGSLDRARERDANHD
ncbi:alpha/beta fold hydrolase [Rarobacter incanus]|uniref:Pimeloyl-ACP methyl ester carboxylesterase n=1 Tax=Rarobacter incanus TaxID=153494 RepID=A0A542SQ76_9MICO|nr:alpha/beta hydrolase [Rarobacter incanus]TQK76770.1 pimeloyl-ACP methyl ester carboxylesterase [Rarobacter incanus]